ncbi:MAG: hypothetical protein CME26_11490 [Gemmatimonadetes bacterium]|nr:hypothetical protein [Gemmatimonadota bacterium]
MPDILQISDPVTPPEWALLQRALIDAQSEAIVAFYEKYFDERGYLQCVPRWGGNDGPDDAAENMLNWTLLHALGAPDHVIDLYKIAWDGHLKQYTEAKTVDVELGREGMYYKEFPTMFDWFHHGEWLSAFVLQGLTDPDDEVYHARTRRFAGFYNGEDVQALNYDRDHRIIRSMFNGSRGPLLRKATALDWAGDPIEIEGRFRPGHGEATFEQMLDHFKGYTDVVGDHPLNLGSTTLGFNAYALTGEAKYRDWVLEYVDAWLERTEANEGIVPSNIGLDGTIGGETDGKWYGGCYGWAFSVLNPATGRIDHRNASMGRTHYAFANAYLLTGDRKYLDLWGNLLDTINGNSREVEGKTLYPRGYGDDGWYEYQETPVSYGALELYFWTQDEKDRSRVPDSPWVDYIEGRNDSYPTVALRRDFDVLRTKLEGMREDTSAPDMRMSDDMNRTNPATTDALIQTMLGGIPTGRVGYPLHCRLRYFDPAGQRAGLPQDVGALITRFDDTTTEVALVNMNPTHERRITVQAGAYGEHRILKVSTAASSLEVNDRAFSVRLEPGCGATVSIEQNRYVNQPTFAFPW